MKNLYVTGYKPNELNIFHTNDKRINYIKESFKKRIISLIEDEGIEWVITSGQAGVELWASEVVLDLKNEYPINLAIIPPFLNQESKWKEDLQNYYNQIVVQADYYESLTKREYENPSQFKLKDKWMIEKTDGCLVLYEDEQKGTPIFFLREVERQLQKIEKNYPIFYITAYDLEEMVREMQYESPDVRDL